MQLGGTRGGVRRAGRVDARRSGYPRRGRPAGPTDLVGAARVPGGDGGGCNAGHRPGGSAPGGRGQRSAASPGHSVRTVRTQRSASALACGGRTGVTRMSASCDRNRSLKLRVNFASWSRSRKRIYGPRSSSTSSRLRACWVTQPPSGLAVTPQRWTRLLSSSTGAQHLQPPQPNGVDGEEVASEDRVTVLAQERSPARGGALGCRRDAGTGEHVAHQGRRHRDPESA